jgi:hypothetical protein
MVVKYSYRTIYEILKELQTPETVFNFLKVLSTEIQPNKKGDLVEIKFPSSKPLTFRYMGYNFFIQIRVYQFSWQQYPDHWSSRIIGLDLNLYNMDRWGLESYNKMYGKYSQDIKYHGVVSNVDLLDLETFIDKKILSK